MRLETDLSTAGLLHSSLRAEVDEPTPPDHTSEVRQTVAQSEENTRWAIGVNQLVAAVAIATVVTLLIIAVTSAGGVQDAPTFGTQSANAPDRPTNDEAMIRALVSFGPIGAWVSVGALLLARANPGRKLKLGRTSPSTRT